MTTPTTVRSGITGTTGTAAGVAGVAGAAGAAGAAGETVGGEPPPEKTFSASKFFVPKIPVFDKEFSPPRIESKSQQSGQSSGNHDGTGAPLGFSSFGRFSKF